MRRLAGLLLLILPVLAYGGEVELTRDGYIIIVDEQGQRVSRHVSQWEAMEKLTELPPGRYMIWQPRIRARVKEPEPCECPEPEPTVHTVRGSVGS